MQQEGPKLENKRGWIRETTTTTTTIREVQRKKKKRKSGTRQEASSGSNTQAMPNDAVTHQLLVCHYTIFSLNGDTTLLESFFSSLLVSFLLLLIRGAILYFKFNKKQPHRELQSLIGNFKFISTGRESRLRARSELCDGDARAISTPVPVAERPFRPHTE